VPRRRSQQIQQDAFRFDVLGPFLQTFEAGDEKLVLLASPSTRPIDDYYTFRGLPSEESVQPFEKQIYRIDFMGNTFSSCGGAGRIFDNNKRFDVMFA
jgi:hypothetical protein